MTNTRRAPTSPGEEMWKGKSRVCIVPTRISFLSVKLRGDPFDGFMVYGIAPWTAQTTKLELGALAALICKDLSQEVVEIHFEGEIIEARIS